MAIILGLGVFLIINVVTHHYDWKAQLSLSTEEKARLLDESSRYSIWNTVPIIILLFTFGGFMYSKPSVEIMIIGLIVYFILIVVAAFITHHAIMKRFSCLNLPAGYISHRKNTFWVRLTSLILFLSWLLVSTVMGF